jgi:serine/threonine-protein kinase MDS1/RIM11
MKLYRLDKIVAHGTFGIVYRATRSNTSELVAIKRVYQDGRYKNRELDILKLVSKYSEAAENRIHDPSMHPNILLMRHYYMDVDLNQDTYLNIVTNFYPETLHS